MKKIGIIDFYIDEWHSNTYLDLFVKGAKELGLDYEVAYGWAESGFEGRLSTEEWCKQKGIEQCQTIEELCEKSDYLLILSPANPEKHLPYAKIALTYGKNTYIDKTFAQNADVAREIYAIAEKYGTNIFSTSALRFSEELYELEGKIDSLTVTGSGRSLGEYVIHQIEMAVTLMGAKANWVRVFNRSNQSTVIIDFDGKLCSLNFSYSHIPFAVDIALEDAESSKYLPIKSDYFYNLAKNILSFFATGKAPFDKKQTICAIAIRDAIMKAVELNTFEQIDVEL